MSTGSAQARFILRGPKATASQTSSPRYHVSFHASNQRLNPVPWRVGEQRIRRLQDEPVRRSEHLYACRHSLRMRSRSPVIRLSVFVPPTIAVRPPSSSRARSKDRRSWTGSTKYSTSTPASARRDPAAPLRSSSCNRISCRACAPWPPSARLGIDESLEQPW